MPHDLIAPRACTKCGVIKPADDFYIVRNPVLRRRTQCKPCTLETNRLADWKRHGQPPSRDYPPDPYAGDPWSWAYVLFRQIPGFPRYAADTSGSIWTCHTSGGKGEYYARRWRRLNPKVHKDGYLRVEIRDDDGLVTDQFVHRLVLIAFRGEAPGGFQACHHPDPTRTNNRLRNLRWDTHAGNQKDRLIVALRAGMEAVPMPATVWGEAHPFAVLTEDKVREIRRRAGLGESRRSLGAAFGVDPRTISRVVNGERWAHVV